MNVLISMVAGAVLGIALGVAGTTLVWLRRPVRSGADEFSQSCELVFDIRRQVHELARLYARPAGAVRDDHPRAPVRLHSEDVQLVATPVARTAHAQLTGSQLT